MLLFFGFYFTEFFSNLQSNWSVWDRPSHTPVNRSVPSHRKRPAALVKSEAEPSHGFFRDYHVSPSKYLNLSPLLPRNRQPLSLRYLAPPQQWRPGVVATPNRRCGRRSRRVDDRWTREGSALLPCPRMLATARNRVCCWCVQMNHRLAQVRTSRSHDEVNLADILKNHYVSQLHSDAKGLLC